MAAGLRAEAHKGGANYTLQLRIGLFAQRFPDFADHCRHQVPTDFCKKIS